MKKIFQKIGRIFITFNQEEGKVLKRPVLIVDNGYAPCEHLHSTVTETKRRIPDSDVSILALKHRRGFLREKFSDLEIIHPDEQIRIKRYALAIQMFKMRKRSYDFVILMSLDITPTMVAVLFMNSKVLLYNQWHQWWELKFKSIRFYSIGFFQFIYNIIIFPYLLVSVLLVFLRWLINIFRFGLSKRRS